MIPDTFPLSTEPDIPGYEEMTRAEIGRQEFNDK